MVNSTILYDRKIELVFCIEEGCGPHMVDCYCCENKTPKVLCYCKMDDCRANCPVCNPKCPPRNRSHQWYKILHCMEQWTLAYTNKRRPNF
ncbi:hypothetical protein BAE44_0022396 [Dichanthelium oligosanthes]|uniref:Uncharacterized protein n=1 Tax=Dichanthelium oligosanthes TaxID=888268 RepID=A0A1E5UUU9_9POAL|nr:hypothetical protein BAE44_0022396 [Dichanthelium oligosanthes]